jgi:hypothetical protein
MGLQVLPGLHNLTGRLPDNIVAMLRTKICLPPGSLWYVDDMINAPQFNWPNRTVIILPKTSSCSRASTRGAGAVGT